MRARFDIFGGCALAQIEVIAAAVLPPRPASRCHTVWERNQDPERGGDCVDLELFGFFQTSLQSRVRRDLAPDPRWVRRRSRWRSWTDGWSNWWSASSWPKTRWKIHKMSIIAAVSCPHVESDLGKSWYLGQNWLCKAVEPPNPRVQLPPAPTPASLLHR